MYIEKYNPNPVIKNPKRSRDCFIRAICKVTGFNWIDVYDTLCKTGRKYGMMPISSFVVYMAYKDIFESHKINNEITLEEFIKSHTVGKFIVMYRIHAVALVDGILYDDPITNYDKDLKYNVSKYFKVKDDSDENN